MKLFRPLLAPLLALSLFSACQQSEPVVTDGTLTITTRPAKTRITIQGEFIKPTPLTGDKTPLPAGTYLVQAKADGYIPQWLQVEVATGKDTIESVRLKRDHGLVLVDSTPPGATIRVYNKDLSGRPAGMVKKVTSPAYLKDLPYGSYIVNASMPQYHGDTFQLHLQERAPKHIQMVLKPNYANLDITSEPTNAKVTIDGELVGNTPLSKQLSAGSYIVDVQLDGYEKVRSEQVEIVAGTPETRNFNLVARKASLSINSDPQGADLYLDGTRIGSTPTTNMPLNPGSYRIEVRKEGYDTHTETVDLDPGESLTPPAFKLENNTGHLRIVTKPARVNVIIDGVIKGKTKSLLDGDDSISSVFSTYLPKGTYSISLERVGYADITKEVEISPKQMVKLTETLIKHFVIDTEVITGHNAGDYIRCMLVEKRPDGSIVIMRSPTIKIVLERSEYRGIRPARRK